jgi:LysR family transcriptional regulator of beta-lactamase
MKAPLIPMASRQMAAADIGKLPLLRSYRADEWPRWFAEARLPVPRITGPLFDSALTMAVAAAAGAGVALLPLPIFGGGRTVAGLLPLSNLSIDAGSYWLTRSKFRPESDAMAAFRGWLTTTATREVRA